MEDEEDCPQNIEIDSESIIRSAFQRSITKVVELLKPDVILDLFVELNLFGDITHVLVRDIREAETTSQKNRAIHDAISRDPSRYLLLKKCLARSRQTSLLDILEGAEKETHDGVIGKGRPCCCSATGSCQLLASIKCDKDQPEFISCKVKDIQHQLIQFYEDKCLTAPVYALIPEVSESLESLYVKPNMRIVDIRGKDLGLDSQVCRKTREKDLTVDMYKDIFYKDHKPCRNIYITGDAGIGKSAFCETMVHTWCRTHTRTRNSKRLSLSENETIMSEFHFLFYISLRYAVGDTDIDQMICNQLPVDNAKELLETENCLVLLDGLDEWTSHENATGSRFTSKGLPRRSLKGKVTVLTTSRPWKLEMLRLKENEIDNQINMTELTKQSVEELSGRILSVMNKTHNTKKQTADFIMSVTDKGLYDHLQTPVLLSLMVCLWYYDVPFGDSKCEIYSNIIDKQIELAEEQKGLHVPCSSTVVSGTNGQTPVIPGCFRSNASCKRYSKLLLSLSKLAFNILFHDDRESSLVFDHKDTEICGMSPSEMDTCLNIGLLTQDKVFVNFVKKSKSISFIHKSHQEFFAALYLTTLDQDTANSLLTSTGKSLDTFLDVSNVLLFLNGMNSKHGDEILKHVRKLAYEDRRVLNYRLSCSGPYDKHVSVVKRIENLIIDCEEERLKNRLPATSQKIDDLIVTNSDRFCHLMKQCEVVQSKCVASVTMFTTTRETRKKDVSELWNRTFDCARASKCLQKIYIWDCLESINVEHIYKTVQDTSSTLACLVLCGVDLSSLGRRLLDILTLPRLLTIGLGDYLDLSHEQLGIVCDFLHEANYIQELRLKKINCLTHAKGHSDCKFTFDVSKNKALQRLFVSGYAEKILIDASNVVLLEARFLEVSGITKDLLECLKGSKQLSEIELTSDFPVDKTAMVNIIPEFEGVKHVHLLNMNFIGMQLKFPKTMKQLEFVRLCFIRIDNASLRHMLDDLPTQRVEIWMGNMRITHDAEEEFVKDYIRRSDKFKITLDDPKWMYFHTVC